MLTQKDEYQALIDAAKSARDSSYSPYSHFSVGAALLTDSGKIFVGANVENASFGATVCAERVAVFRAACEGERTFVAIAVAGAPHNEEPRRPCPPCGICLQVISEFCTPELDIIMPSGDGYVSKKLGELMPMSFDGTKLT